MNRSQLEYFIDNKIFNHREIPDINKYFYKDGVIKRSDIVRIRDKLFLVDSKEERIDYDYDYDYLRKQYYYVARQLDRELKIIHDGETKILDSRFIDDIEEKFDIYKILIMSSKL